MIKKIKIITSSVEGGVLDSAKLINKCFKEKGYNSSLVKISIKNRNIVDRINIGDYIIFHMSAYGFQKKGIPLWLINEIKQVKKKSSYLIIHFHELNVNKKIWQLGFLVMILQKFINIQLLKKCDLWVTSTLEYANWLSTHSHQKKKYICPVHSNIKYDLINKNKNKNIVILFGTAGSRLEIYNKYFETIKKWLNKNKFELYDVGPKIEDKNIFDQINSCTRIKIFGWLDEKKIRSMFSGAYLGIFAKPKNLIDKSGTFATYAKFKICPINIENINDSNNNVTINSRYLSFLPKKNLNKKIINQICKRNFIKSKKNNVESYLKIYLKKFY